MQRGLLGLCNWKKCIVSCESLFGDFVEPRVYQVVKFRGSFLFMNSNTFILNVSHTPDRSSKSTCRMETMITFAPSWSSYLCVIHLQETKHQLLRHASEWEVSQGCWSHSVKLDVVGWCLALTSRWQKLCVTIIHHKLLRGHFLLINAGLLSHAKMLTFNINILNLKETLFTWSPLLYI